MSLKKNIFKYKVFIPTAGIGSRLESETKFINKSLVALDNKPLISHIIEKFDSNQEFVVAIGYKGELVKQYLRLAHKKIKIKFVKIKNFKGKGSGLGLTLLKSKKYLQCPFIFYSCDTYIKEKVVMKKNNWVGISNTYNNRLYRTLSTKEKKIKKIFNKNKQGGTNNYIGVAGILDFKIFWKAMKHDSNTINNGEVVGLNDILKNKLLYQKFNWIDCGNINALRNLRKDLLKRSKAVILPKEDEFISFVNNKVIKFNDDKNFIKKRVIRQKILNKYTPSIIDNKENFYLYKKVKGKVFSKNADTKNFNLLLVYLEKFWFNDKVHKINKNNFKKKCLKFYKDKTEKRIKLFHLKNKINDISNIVNGIKVPSLKKILNQIDWNYVKSGVPVNFHGDLHFENILINKNSFKLLDWRQDFSGLLYHGDLYYDLAKLYHGMLVPHDNVVKNEFFISMISNKINIKIKRPKNYPEIIKIFENWIKQKNLDLQKIKIITGLIFLNIAPLHHHPYSLFLYFLGKQTIYAELQK